MSFPEALGELFLADAPLRWSSSGPTARPPPPRLMAQVLQHAGRDPSFLVGGVPLNFNEGFRLGARASTSSLEGDEYDTAYFDKGPKFLHYRPRTAIFTSAEFDHADIYRDTPHYESAFEKLRRPPARRTASLAACTGYPQRAAHRRAARGARSRRYCARDDVEADWEARGLSLGPDGAHFEVDYAGEPESAARSRWAARTTSRTRSACYAAADAPRAVSRTRSPPASASLPRREAAAGGARRGARRGGHRRLRPPPDGGARDHRGGARRSTPAAGWWRCSSRAATRRCARSTRTSTRTPSAGAGGGDHQPAHRDREGAGERAHRREAAWSRTSPRRARTRAGSSRPTPSSRPVEGARARRRGAGHVQRRVRRPRTTSCSRRWAREMSLRAADICVAAAEAGRPRPARSLRPAPRRRLQGPLRPGHRRGQGLGRDGAPDLARARPRSAHPRRGERRARRRRGLLHRRPARRHHQLRARHPGVLLHRRRRGKRQGGRRMHRRSVARRSLSRRRADTARSSARRRERALSTSRRPTELEEAVVCTGFPYGDRDKLPR